MLRPRLPAAAQPDSVRVTVPGAISARRDGRTLPARIWLWTTNVLSRDRDEDLVAHRGVRAAVQSQVHDSAIERRAGNCSRTVSEDLAKRVDGRGVVVVSWSLICSLNASDWPDASVQTVYQQSDGGAAS